MSVTNNECEKNPNDLVCYSCLRTPPVGCNDTCAGDPAPLPTEEDRANLRCVKNQERCGVDLMYPVSRAVAGLTQRRIFDSQSGLKAASRFLVATDGTQRELSKALAAVVDRIVEAL